jgi:hypothetical protein
LNVSAVLSISQTAVALGIKGSDMVLLTLLWLPGRILAASRAALYELFCASAPDLGVWNPGLASVKIVS